MSFPLYLDEQQSQQVATRLAKAGYDALTANNAGLANKKTSDEAQLTFAAEQGRAIVTGDIADFHRLQREWWEQSRHHSGIIIVTSRLLPADIYDGIIRLQELYSDGIYDLILPI